MPENMSMQSNIPMPEGQSMCMQDFSETSMEITLVHAGVESCKPYHAVAAARSEYIIHFILSGEGFYSANGSTWHLGPGQMFLLYPDEPIVYCSNAINPWSYLWIGFKGIRVDTILKNCGFSKNRLCLPAPAPDQYIECFHDLFAHRGTGFSEDLCRESILLKLFSLLAAHHAGLAPGTDQEQIGYSDNTYVNLAIDYIGKMYMQGIGVSDVADSIGITRSHLNHVFQKELNISIQNFLIDFRMHKAANLLVSTGLSIKEISSQVGYSDQLVFSKAFKKKFGLSPKSYRASQNKNETGNV